MRIRGVLGNSQRLDGGALFGNVPRTVWSRWHEPDELGRIALNCRALLVEDQGRFVLLETGIGNFFPPELKERYGVVETTAVLCEYLASSGLTPDDIDVVILSHLHFDHAGALISAYQADQAPSLLFRNARFVVGQRAFERASRPHPRDRASFIPNLPELLWSSGRLELVTPASARTLLGDNWHFFESNGHTPGMLHTTVCGSQQRVFYCADLIPGTSWVHLPITMGYDRFPEAVIDEKALLLEQFAKDGTWLSFTHDPLVAMARISRDEKGRYTTTTTSLLADWLDLDVAA